jgi:hypothetical protein
VTTETQVQVLREIAAGHKRAFGRRKCCPHCGGEL